MAAAVAISPAGLETRFRRLVEAWKGDCPPSSRIEKLVMQPAYQQIIGLGPDALPLLLRELNRSPDHWFWALQAITGDNPVKPENRGDITAMTADWNAWAAANAIDWNEVP